MPISIAGREVAESAEDSTVAEFLVLRAPNSETTVSRSAQAEVAVANAGRRGRGPQRRPTWRLRVMGAPAAPEAKLAGASCRPTPITKNLMCRAAVLIDHIQVCTLRPHVTFDKSDVLNKGN